MKILWVSNGPTEEIQLERYGKNVGSVSWVTGLLNAIRSKDISIDILYMDGPNGGFYNTTINKTSYFSFIRSNNTYTANKKNHAYFEKILKNEYDLVHFFGTEYYHTLEIFNMIEDKRKVLISIQGLCSIYENHYLHMVPYNVIRRKTLRDLIRNDSLMKQKKEYYFRGRNELSVLTNALNITGRTDWDKSCTFFMNPNRKYYHANEILRNNFYNNSWDINKCERHSIFLSQVYGPIKGFHIMLEAAGILKKYYPNLKIRTTGDDFVHNKSIKAKIKLSSYRKYIIELLNKYNLMDNIEFLGNLSEDRMIEEYKRANVFVSSSTIENSPNSVCEAMILGVPTVSSDVGGVKNILSNFDDGYIYPSDEPYMLAYYIKELFDDDDLCLKFSKNSQNHAKCTHDREKCANDMYKIYLDIINNH